MSYNTALAALQKLVRQIENEEIQLDNLAEKVTEAHELVRYCETRLRTIQADIDGM